MAGTIRTTSLTKENKEGQLLAETVTSYIMIHVVPAGSKMKNLIAVIIIYLSFPILLVCAVQNGRALVWKSIDKKTALACLLYQECPRDNHLEAVKAQTVLLRSSLCLYTSGEWNDLLQKSTKIQQEKEYIRFKNTYFTCIEETENLVIKYNGQIMRGIYHEVSTGKTRNGRETGLLQYNGLISADSSWDVQAQGYQQVFSFSDISLRRRFFKNQKKIQLSVVLRDNEEYVQTVQWGDSYVNGDYVRESLSLPSSCFSIKYQDDQWIFTCRGVGHGLGMSLYGANILAQQGKHYREIIEHYFPNYDISTE